MLVGAEPADVALHGVECVGHEILDPERAQYAQEVLCADAAVCGFEAADYAPRDACPLCELGLGEAA